MSYFYSKGAEEILKGAIDFTTDMKIVLVNLALYTPVRTVDALLTDIPTNALISTSAALSAPVISKGVYSVSDELFTSLSGAEVGAFVLYKSSDSKLIALIDEAPQLPFTPDGSNWTVEWPSTGVLDLTPIADSGVQLYWAGMDDILNGGINLTTAVLNCAMLDSSYTFDPNHTVYADISGSEIGTDTMTTVTATNGVLDDNADVVDATVTGTVESLVIYETSGPLLIYIDGYPGLPSVGGGGSVTVKWPNLLPGNQGILDFGGKLL